MKKRNALGWAAACLLAPLLPAARAQERFPGKPVEVIVPWGAGGGADVLGRILGRWLEADLKAAFPVSNLPGASGMIGLGRMVSLPADGHAIGILTGDSLMMAATPTASFKFADATTLAVLVRQPSGLFLPKASRFANWQEVAKEAQAKPGSVTVAITGPNTADDLTVQYLASRKIALTGVPYTKPGERYSAVLGGHVDLLYEQAGDVRGFLDAGQLRPILFFSQQRLPAPFADVPASGEFGYEILLPQVRAVLIKAGTDAQRLQVLQRSIERFAASTEYRSFLDQQLALPDSYLPTDRAQPFPAGRARSAAQTDRELRREIAAAEISVGHQRRQQLRRLAAQHGMGRAIQFGGLGIEDHHARAGAPRRVRQPGRRIDQARGADHQHERAAPGLALGRIQHGRRQHFAEPHHAGTQQITAASAARRTAGLGAGQLATGSRGVEPEVFEQVAVQRQHAGAAGTLVQPVDVLGDQRQPPGPALRESRQRKVPGIRGHLGNHLAAERIPVPHPLRVGAESVLGGEFFRLELGPEAGLRVAERGHARLGADARAGQQRHAARLGQPLAHGGEVRDHRRVPIRCRTL